MSDATLTRPVIAGNWKMHKAPRQARAFVEDLTRRLQPDAGRTVLLFPPAISFPATADAATQRPDLLLGVQNIHWEPEGAFTGEISAPMARAAGAACTLVGHSERRHVFGETEEETGRKVRAALDAGLVPVLCIGETLDQRKADHVDEICLSQLEAGLGGLDDDELGHVLVAYEPVWAIGTGETATPHDASAAHGTVRRWLRGRIGDAADVVPILYGGSVKPHNAAELLSAEDVDGVLVGGASLDPESFAAIARAGGR